MRTIVVLATLVAAAMSIPAETYSEDFDNFNADELIENQRLLKNYCECFRDNGPCTAQGAEIKKIIPDALQTKCAKCSTKQRPLIRKVIRAFQSQIPDCWTELLKKEDPNNQYAGIIQEFVDSSD